MESMIWIADEMGRERQVLALVSEEGGRITYHLEATCSQI